MKNNMKIQPKCMCAVVLVTGLFVPKVFAAATPGGAKLTATINDFAVQSSTRHYTVVWLTTPAAPDGYTSATATSYAATDPSPPATGLASNPINITWNGKDASGVVAPDGDYKFWIEYAEDFGTHGTDTGGLTTGGLTFTKGPSSFSVNPSNRGTVGSPSGGFNFTSMSIVWTPSVPATFTSVQVDGSKLVMSGTGPANGTYAVVTTTNVSTPMGQWTPIATNTFSAGGSFSYTNTLNPGVTRTFYRLRVP
jgi:hypothetical protein